MLILGCVVSIPCLGGASNGVILNSSETFDHARKRFVKGPQLPIEVYAHCAMDMGHGDIIVAGENNTNYS